MIRPIRRIRLIRLIGLIGLMGLIGPIGVLAQSAPAAAGKPVPVMIVSWQAHAFAPAGYQGKILPPRGDTVSLFLEFIDNNKIVSLADNEIRWSVNGQFLASGQGLIQATLTLNQFTTRTYKVKVVVKDYEGADFEKTIDIKRADPLAVIASPQLGPRLTGSEAKFTAAPYFFNANSFLDFTYTWYVNNVGLPNNVDNLTVDLRRADNDQPISVGVLISNKVNDLETAYQTKTFTVQK